jgi:hypothetical protein
VALTGRIIVKRLGTLATCTLDNARDKCNHDRWYLLNGNVVYIVVNIAYHVYAFITAFYSCLTRKAQRIGLMAPSGSVLECAVE